MSGGGMRRLELVAMRSQRDGLLRELAVFGVRATEAEPREAWFSRESAGAMERGAQLEGVLRAIAVLEEYAPRKAPLFARRSAGQGAGLDGAALESALELARGLCDKGAEIERIETERSRVRFDIERFAPWQGFDVPFDLVETRTCEVLTGMIPAAVDLGGFEGAFDANVGEGAVFEVSGDRFVRYVAVIVMKDKRSAAEEVLREFGFVKSSLAGIEGTAGASIERLKGRLSELEREMDGLVDWVFSCAGRRDELRACAEALRLKVEAAILAERVLYSRFSFVLDGWVPEGAERELGGVLSRYDCVWETRAAGAGENPPQVRRKGIFWRGN